MATLTYTAAADTSSPYFRNFTGLYTFYPNIPDGATITSIKFNFAANAMSLYSGSINADYGFYYASSSSIQPETTTNTSNTLTWVVDSDDCYAITNTRNLVYSSSSEYVPSSTTWSVSSDKLSLFRSSPIYIYFCRSNVYGTAGNGTLAYHTVNGYYGALTCTITYETATVSAPTNITVVQHPTNGTCTLSWSAATGSGGSGTVTYGVYNVSDGLWIDSNISSTSYTMDIPIYNYTFTYKVYAFYSTASAASSNINVLFYPPSISGPTSIGINPSSGNSVTISWPAATFSWTTGTITYALYYKLNSTSASWIRYGNSNSTSITIPPSWFAANATAGDIFYFQVDAIGSNLTNNATGEYSTVTSGSSLSSGFTYVVSTVTTTENTLAYNDGTQWVNCLVYYNSGNEWVQCIPYYNDGANWIEISSE